jgi:hypothetical protein
MVMAAKRRSSRTKPSRSAAFGLPRTTTNAPPLVPRDNADTTWRIDPALEVSITARCSSKPSCAPDVVISRPSVVTKRTTSRADHAACTMLATADTATSKLAASNEIALVSSTTVHRPCQGISSVRTISSS